MTPTSERKRGGNHQTTIRGSRKNQRARGGGLSQGTWSKGNNGGWKRVWSPTIREIRKCKRTEDELER